MTCESAVEWLEVPGGRFTIGSPEDEELAWEDERPEHQLDLEGFWIEAARIEMDESGTQKK